MSDSDFHADNLDSKLSGLEKKLDDAKGETKRVQILMAIVTALIGFGVYLAQSRVQQHIDQQSAVLGARLQLTQEFYGRKLAIYEGVHQQMAGLLDALSELQLNSGAKKTAVDAVHNLYVSYTTGTLYLSDAAVSQLQKLVDLGNRIPPLDPSGTVTMQQVDEQIASIEVQMKTDLQIKELGTIPGARGTSNP